MVRPGIILAFKVSWQPLADGLKDPSLPTSLSLSFPPSLPPHYLSLSTYICICPSLSSFIFIYPSLCLYLSYLWAQLHLPLSHSLFFFDLIFSLYLSLSPSFYSLCIFLFLSLPHSLFLSFLSLPFLKPCGQYYSLENPSFLFYSDFDYGKLGFFIGASKISQGHGREHQDTLRGRQGVCVGMRATKERKKFSLAPRWDRRRKKHKNLGPENFNSSS